MYVHGMMVGTTSVHIIQRLGMRKASLLYTFNMVVWSQFNSALQALEKEGRTTHLDLLESSLRKLELDIEQQSQSSKGM